MAEPVTAYQIERLRSLHDFLRRDDQRYRVVITDSESADGIALVCTSPEHPEDDKLQQWGMYDCCDTGVIETWHENFAAFVVGAIIAVPALLDELDVLRARVAELGAVDPETAADIKVADALARHKAARYCPDCGSPRVSLAHGACCLSALRETI